MSDCESTNAMDMLPSDVDQSHASHNERWMLKVGSQLLKDASSYVVGGSVGASAARAFATFLETNSYINPRDGWTFKVAHSRSQPPLILRGFTKSYNRLLTSSSMSSSELLRAQRKVSIIGNDLWAFSILTQHAPGFHDMLMGAKELAMSISTIDPREETLVLKSFHIIKQLSVLSASDMSTTTFGVHQDTEEDVDNAHEPRFATVVVRLSSLGTTQMFVEGAAAPFVYGSSIGDAGAFLSKHYHRSLPSFDDQTKIAFFFAKHVKSAREKRRRE